MRIARLIAVLAAAALLYGAGATAPSLGQEIVLDLDPERTTVRFTLADVLHTVHGTFKLKCGNIRFDPATDKISGEVVVDATSGNSGSEARDSRMHKNILESGKYPEIVFVPDRVDGSVAPQGESQIQLHGLFRIHGAEHEITAAVKVQMLNGQPTATAHFTVPYVKWGMKNPSTLLLRVSDKVEVEATARAR